MNLHFLAYSPASSKLMPFLLTRQFLNDEFVLLPFNSPRNLSEILNVFANALPT